jgi:MOSC domain-containing protein YiiM
MGPPTTTWTGRLGHIHLTAAAAEPMRSVDACTLTAGVGIPEDRYALRTGTYSHRHHIDRQVTLIEAEVLAALARDHGVVLLPHEHRRNLTTEGVPLGHLVGAYFAVGECLLYGGRLNVPCRHLEELTGKSVFRPLVHRSGLNARVVVGGRVRVGDLIRPVDAGDVDPVVRAGNEEHPLEVPPEVF